MKQFHISEFPALLVSVLAAFSAGIVGAFFTTEAVRIWYPTLVKPMLNPPSWIFAPVWSTLYVLMATAAWLVYRNRQKPGAEPALWFYAFHLLVNALWSIVFFGFHAPLVAFFVILVLDLCVLALMITFSRFNRTAGLLFVPYLVWVLFASYLNFMIVHLNP
jgi:tryptophan-rich sensory protein